MFRMFSFCSLDSFTVDVTSDILVVWKCSSETTIAAADFTDWSSTDDVGEHSKRIESRSLRELAFATSARNDVSYSIFTLPFVDVLHSVGIRPTAT